MFQENGDFRFTSKEKRICKVTQPALLPSQLHFFKSSVGRVIAPFLGEGETDNTSYEYYRPSWLITYKLTLRTPLWEGGAHNEKRRDMYRQGDLLFIQTNKEPYGNLSTSKDVLRSSVTGHAHRLSKGSVYINESVNRENRGNFFIVLPNGAELLHEEHKTISLPVGNYEVIRQREVNGYVQD